MMNLMSFFRLLHGISFLLLLVSGAVVCFFLLVPWTVAGFIHTEPVYIARRRYVSWINKLYFLYAVVLLEHVAGIKLFIHGQTPEFVDDDNVFVISNHRTRIDWMFSAWVYAAALKSYPFLVLVLKDELKQVPFYGWCMQVMMYMFLSRKKDNDLPHMRKCFEYYEQTNAVSTSMFIFPEGTDLHSAAIARSNACKSLANKMHSISHSFINSYRLDVFIVAEEKKLPVLKHVLYPRPAGFQLCLSEARRRSAVLHDITIAYKDFEDGKRTSDLDLVKGTLPPHRYPSRWLDNSDDWVTPFSLCALYRHIPFGSSSLRTTYSRLGDSTG